MNQAALSPADPVPASPRPERRRRIRHKLQSPVYASFKSPQASVVDLSELLDLSEDGFSVHTPDPLEPEHPLALTLDLSETGTYIHGHGVAIWSDVSGRGGIRFSELSETSRNLLKEWLFTNLLVAATNHAARSKQRASKDEIEAVPETAALPVAAVVAGPVAPPVGASSPALSPMDAVREQIRASGDPLAALNIVTGCAREWTAGTGAALALRVGDKLVCCARSGETAPPIGAPVDVTHGLSGECVRSGRLVSSEDTANDPRVDAETCRALDIGSILAVPILADSHVVGLLEVFAPRPRAFRKHHETLLLQLAEAAPKSPPAELAGLQPLDVQTPSAISTPSAFDRPAAPIFTVPSPAPRKSQAPKSPESNSPESPSKEAAAKQLPRSFYLALMAFIALACPTAAYLGYLAAPVIQSRWFQSGGATASAAGREPGSSRTVATTPEELQRLADSGDAEAQYWIGIRYGTGANVPQNDTEAAKWFLRSAEQGYVQAQARLGSYYWSGRGVPKDLAKAYFWASLAWAQGDENSKMLLEGLASQMTRAQVVAAHQQADTWLRQHNQPTTARKTNP